MKRQYSGYSSPRRSEGIFLAPFERRVLSSRLVVSVSRAHVHPAAQAMSPRKPPATMASGAGTL